MCTYAVVWVTLGSFMFSPFPLTISLSASSSPPILLPVPSLLSAPVSLFPPSHSSPFPLFRPSLPSHSFLFILPLFSLYNPFSAFDAVGWAAGRASGL